MTSDDENVMSDLAFSDETTFHMSGSCYILGLQNPMTSVELQRYSRR
jgi:hypothetical protein